MQLNPKNPLCFCLLGYYYPILLLISCNKSNVTSVKLNQEADSNSNSIMLINIHQVFFF